MSRTWILFVLPCVLTLSAGIASAAPIDLLAGNIGDSPTVADLVYDPTTGSLTMDAGEAAGGVITVFQLESAGDFIHTNFVGPAGGTFGGMFLDVGPSVLADADLAGVGFAGAHNMGNVVPAGLTLVQLEALLTNAVYTGAFGTGQQTFDLVLIPEPATMALVALGGLALIRRRRA